MPLDHAPIGDTGFSFVRVSVDILSQTRPKVPTPITDKNHVIVVCETGRLNNGLLNDLENKPFDIRFRTGSLGFTPLDTNILFPGAKVLTIREVGEKFNFDAWARKTVEIPGDLDVTFERDKYGNKGCSIIARTVKKGRVVNIRKKIDPEKLFAPHVSEIFEELRRTAPAPSGDLLAEPLPDYTCGAHVAALLRQLDETGHAIVRSWIEKDLINRQKTNPAFPYQGSTATVPGSFLIGAKVTLMVLRTTTKSNSILADLKLHGGHTLVDDDTGAKMVLETQLPETITSAFQKRSVGDIIDVDWARPLTVRTVPINDGRKVQFRVFSDNVPFEMREPVKVDGNEIERRIKHAFENGLKTLAGGRGPIWSEVDTALLPVLTTMDRGKLAIVLTKLEMFSQQSLEPYGYPGWSIKSQGSRLIAIEQPAIPVEQLGILK